jgi:hypothetical protein
MGVLGAWILGLALARAVAPEVAPATNLLSATAKAAATNPVTKSETAGHKNAETTQTNTTEAPKTAAQKPASFAAEKKSPKPSAAPLVPDKERYLSIVRRNPFGLKDPPPPKPPPSEPEPEVKPSALKITGISTLLGGKHAMFVLQEKGKKPIYSGLVAEGDTDAMIAGLQVVAIDPKAKSVRVNYGGSELLLDFKNNGIEPPKAALAQKGKPGARPSVTRRTVTRPGTSSRPVASRTSSSRFNSSHGGYRAGSTSFRSSGARTYASPPSRSTRSSAANQPRRLSPAEQLVVLRAQQEEARRAGITLPPVPPVPGANNGNSGAIPPPPLPPVPR